MKKPADPMKAVRDATLKLSDAATFAFGNTHDARNLDLIEAALGRAQRYLAEAQAAVKKARKTT